MKQNHYDHAYVKDYIFARNDFYIHKHAACIGRAEGGSALSETNLINLMSVQKTSASAASQNQYLELFIQNLYIGENEQRLLNEAFDNDPKRIAEEIDKQIKEKLQKGINQDTLKKLYINQIEAIGISSKLFSEDGRSAMAAFAKLLKCIGETCELIEGPAGTALAQLLSDCRKRGKISNMGSELSRALITFSERYPSQIVEGTRISYAYQALRGLAKRLATGKLASGKKLNKENIKNVVEKVFNPGFAEAIGSQINAVAGLAFHNSAIKMQGKVTTPIKFTDSQGKVVNSTTLRNSAAAGKVDFKVEGASFTFSSSNPSVDGIEMKINLGFSNKFYRTASFDWSQSIIPTSKNTFGGGSGGSLEEAISSLFGSTFMKYLAYNTIAHEESLPRATLVLTDLILTRQINRIFATRGGESDFAQYLLVNGKIVSMLDILNYMNQHFVGRSKSQMTDQIDQAVSLSIKNRTAIIDAVNNKDTRARVLITNKAIRTAKVTAFLHMDKLAQAVSL